MKKKLMAVLALVLVIALSVAGTYAYLTSQQEVVNTFTVGNVALALDEADVDNSTPNADRDTANSYKLIPGHTYTKDPTVTVLDKSEAAYVRMKVTFNNASQIIAMCTDPEFADDEDYLELKNAFPIINLLDVNDNGVWTGVAADNDFDTLDMLADTNYFVYDNGSDTLTYYYYYYKTVAATNGDVKLPTLFDSITVPEWVTNDQLAALKDFEINVVAEAIQADGFANADAAWAAFAEQA